ncbi:MAG: hypothetical protein RQ760_22510, partial [Sedimentisphaerales bacterium]|nr:hypothetical protein [Sedimentisphaerales bacterium]
YLPSENINSESFLKVVLTENEAESDLAINEIQNSLDEVESKPDLLPESVEYNKNNLSESKHDGLHSKIDIKDEELDEQPWWYLSEQYPETQIRSISRFKLHHSLRRIR